MIALRPSQGRPPGLWIASFTSYSSASFSASARHSGIVFNAKSTATYRQPAAFANSRQFRSVFSSLANRITPMLTISTPASRYVLITPAKGVRSWKFACTPHSSTAFSPHALIFSITSPFCLK